MPTRAQAISSVCVCQSLSDMLQPIHLFRYDALSFWFNLVQKIQFFILVVELAKHRANITQDFRERLVQLEENVVKNKNNNAIPCYSD